MNHVVPTEVPDLRDFARSAEAKLPLRKQACALLSLACGYQLDVSDFCLHVAFIKESNKSLELLSFINSGCHWMQMK